MLWLAVGIQNNKYNSFTVMKQFVAKIAVQNKVKITTKSF